MKIKERYYKKVFCKGCKHRLKCITAPSFDHEGNYCASLNYAITKYVMFPSFCIGAFTVATQGLSIFRIFMIVFYIALFSIQEDLENVRKKQYIKKKNLQRLEKEEIRQLLEMDLFDQYDEVFVFNVICGFFRKLKGVVDACKVKKKEVEV